ncbi:Ig-like domain repeat protein [Streptomyces sp. NPDC051569]|uniref:Ig-like domain repeat protein n=1 Tax=Streptomyces sp. NPDC051569 TaxID=3365661 RepID=UPI00379C8E2C
MGTKRPTAALAAIITAAIAAGTIAVAGPAAADPATGTFGTYVGVGSDTTQDVLGGLADTVLPNVASYDATGSALIKSRANGPEFSRPNGSGAGTKALSAALSGDPDPVKGKDGALMAGQVDFARSSGGPSVSGETLVYIPFGRDAVGYVAKGDHLKNLTPEQLKEIYSGAVTTIGGKPVHPFIPQASSGTRKFFLNALGVADASVQIPADHVVEENKADGVIQQDGDLIPFSVASWVAQINNVAPDRSSKAAEGGAFVGALTLKNSSAPVSPVTTIGDKLAPVEAYYNDSTFGRDVYNVVPSRAVETSSAFFDKGLYDLFVTEGAHKPAMASAAAQNTIARYGFLNEPYNGSIDPQNHAKYGGLEGSYTLTKPEAVGSLTATAPAARQLKLSWTAPFATALPVTDYRVLVTNAAGALAYSKDIKAPATSLTIDLPAGKYTAEVYAANLVGGGPAKTVTGTVTDAAVVKTASKTTATASPASVAYGTARTVGVTVTGASVPTGKATVTEGATTLGTGTLDKSGKVSVALPASLSVGTHTLTVSYGGDTKLNASAATVKLTVTKAASKTAATASPAKVAYGTARKINVAVTGKAVPTGKVTVLEGKTSRGTGTLDKSGKVSVALPASLSVGTHTFSVSFGGDTRHNASSVAVKVTVTKATASLKSSAPTTVKPSARAKVTATVTATGTVPTGTVRILEGKKVIGTATLKNGKVTITLPKLAKGKHTLHLVYVGSGTVNAGTGKNFVITSK